MRGTSSNYKIIAAGIKGCSRLSKLVCRVVECMDCSKSLSQTVWIKTIDVSWTVHSHWSCRKMLWIIRQLIVALPAASSSSSRIMRMALLHFRGMASLVCLVSWGLIRSCLIPWLITHRGYLAIRRVRRVGCPVTRRPRLLQFRPRPPVTLISSKPQQLPPS